MNVLIIPEDYRKDQFILGPIVRALLSNLNQPAIVEVLRDPLVGGIDQALNTSLLDEIVQANKWKVDLFLLCVDRDGEQNRRGRLDAIENRYSTLASGKVMVAENAWQELEVWLLAGHDLLPGWNWQTIRQDRDPKEAFYNRLVTTRGLQDDPGFGRKTLGLEAARRYRRIYSRCPEDIQVLEKRVKVWIQEGEVITFQRAKSLLGQAS